MFSLNLLTLILIIIFLEMSHCVALAGLKFRILLPQPCELVGSHECVTLLSFDYYGVELVSANASGVSFLLLPACCIFSCFSLPLVGGADPSLNKPFIREGIWDCTEQFRTQP